MDEAKLLASFVKSRKAWEKTAGVVTPEDMSAQGARLYEEIVQFYTSDPDAQSVDRDIIAGRIEQSIQNRQQQTSLLTRLDQLFDMEVAPNSVAAYAIEVKRRAVGLELGQLLHKGTAKREVILDKLEEYRDLLSREGLELVKETTPRPTVGDLTGRRDEKHRIPILPGELNIRLKGGALRGHHIVVFARPEVGKSLFCINLVSGLLRRGYRVLWVENEDNIDDVWSRFYERLTEVEEEDMAKDPERWEAVLVERGIDNLFLYEATPGTPFELKQKIEEHEPDVMVVNQIRNLSVANDNRVNQLETAAQTVRNLGKQYKMLTISVTQAGESGDDKAYLDMGDVDYSNTGIPSTADLMIGVGATKGMLHRGLRGISLPKNKISGIHDTFTVYFDENLSKVKSNK